MRGELVEHPRNARRSLGRVDLPPGSCGAGSGNGTGGDVLVKHDTSEDLVCRLGLVPRG